MVRAGPDLNGHLLGTNRALFPVELPAHITFLPP